MRTVYPVERLVQTVRLEEREPFVTADGSTIRELAGVPSGNAARSEGTANSGVPAKTILKAVRASTSRARAPHGHAASVCLRCLASFLRTISRLSGDR